MTKTFEELVHDTKASAIFMALFDQKPDGLLNWADDCEIIAGAKARIMELGYDADDVSQFLKEQYDECEEADDDEGNEEAEEAVA